MKDEGVDSDLRAGGCSVLRAEDRDHDRVRPGGEREMARPGASSGDEEVDVQVERGEPARRRCGRSQSCSKQGRRLLP